MKNYSVGWDTPKVAFADLVGKTFVSISGKPGDDVVEIVCADGAIYVMHHDQDCCERVRVESIVGDLADLVGTPILVAEETSGQTDPEGYKTEDEYRESFTWTFYKLATVKGWVDVRWLGESNGYYGETVELKCVVPGIAKAKAKAEGELG